MIEHRSREATDVDALHPEEGELIAGDTEERGEAGQGLVEYGLIIFLVAIVVIAVLLLVGPRIGSIFSRITALG